MLTCVLTPVPGFVHATTQKCPRVHVLAGLLNCSFFRLLRDPGHGEKQSLRLSIEKINTTETQLWNDEHSMVAFSLDELIDILKPYFEVHVFEHDYEKLLPYNKHSGNAIFTCVKI